MADSTEGGGRIKRTLSFMFTGASKHAQEESNQHLMFERPLEDVMSVEETAEFREVRVPCAVHRAAMELQRRGLREEGLFRISGNKLRVSAIQEAYDKGVPLELTNEDVHDVGSLFKLFFRVLPEPLLTMHLYDTFMSAKDDIKAMKVAISQLPVLNRHLLAFLVRFLVRVAAEADANKMTPFNLGVCFGPALLFNGSTELVQDDSPHVVQFMIDQCSVLFPDDVAERMVEGPLSPPSAVEKEKARAEAKERIAEEEERIAKDQKAWEQREKEEKMRIKHEKLKEKERKAQEKKAKKKAKKKEKKRKEIEEEVASSLQGKQVAEKESATITTSATPTPTPAPTPAAATPSVEKSGETAPLISKQPTPSDGGKKRGCCSKCTIS